MHDLEPYWRWRDKYTAEEDEHSPFFEREYNEMAFTDTIYNYYVHPQWDNFGSSTLLVKILWADYDDGFAILEFIGEWNDLLHNDIMHLKREVIDVLIQAGITKFVLIGENVLNFHADDDSYYEEWYEDISDGDGWIIPLNFNEHVREEMQMANLSQYLILQEGMNDLAWRKLEPDKLIDLIESRLIKYLY